MVSTQVAGRASSCWNPSHSHAVALERLAHHVALEVGHQPHAPDHHAGLGALRHRGLRHPGMNGSTVASQLPTSAFRISCSGPGLGMGGMPGGAAGLCPARRPRMPTGRDRVRRISFACASPSEWARQSHTADGGPESRELTPAEPAPPRPAGLRAAAARALASGLVRQPSLAVELLVGLRDQHLPAAGARGSA